MLTKINDDDLPRSNKVINDCGFDKSTLKQREKEILELVQLYPSLPESMLLTAWNWHQSTSVEEQNILISSGDLDKPSTRS